MNRINYKIVCLLFTTIGLATSYAQTTSYSNVKVEAVSPTTIFEELDGIAIVELESVSPGNGWRGESLAEGFTANNYFRWASSDSFNKPGSGLTEYTIRINNPGTYHFRWHNKIMHGTEPTESNDSWLRIPDAADFFARNGSSIKYPNGGMFVQSTVTTEGASSDGWMKVYCSGTTAWTWSCRTSDNDPHEIYATFDTAGFYTIQISARSKNHAIDRFVLFNDSLYTIEQATNKTLEEITYRNSAEGRYALAVNYGTGCGNFSKNESIEIKADNAPSNKVFDQWTGDIDHITDIYESTTNLTVAEKNMVLTATYMDDGGTSVSDTELSKLRIYPNPTKGSFAVVVPDMNNPVLSIYNLIGKKMYETKASVGKRQIKNHNLIRGTYIIRVSGDSKTLTELITIQ